MQKYVLVILCFILANNLLAQSNGKMDFEKYNPISTLKVPEHKISRAKFPFIDVHNHQWNMGTQDLKILINDMDLLHMAVMVNLSGGNGSGLKKMADNIKSNYPNRFILFANIDFAGIGEPGWP